MLGPNKLAPKAQGLIFDWLKAGKKVWPNLLRGWGGGVQGGGVWGGDPPTPPPPPSGAKLFKGARIPMCVAVSPGPGGGGLGPSGLGEDGGAGGSWRDPSPSFGGAGNPRALRRR